MLQTNRIARRTAISSHVLACLLGIVVLLLAGCSQETGTSSDSARNVIDTEYPEAVFWGDTHLHTANSVDAFGFGTRLDAEQALRFARGEEVTSTRGVQAKLSRPLDFLVIADHSDGLGLTKQIYEAPRILVRDPLLRRWWDEMHESEAGSLAVTAEIIDRAARGDLPDHLINSARQTKRVSKIWKAHVKTVERYNDPGTFTAFAGFEYTPMPNGNNLHRVVMFKDGKDKTKQVIPLGSFAHPDPEELWAWMQEYEDTIGGRVLAMPHNSNVSNGLMFAMERLDGSPIDAAYAEIRAKYEPVVEITQIKGDSESHPFLSPNDEFADFGDAGWDKCNLTCEENMPPESYSGSYVREALKRGLEIEQAVGVNPYAFGVIGATDSHTSLATADEDNFYGKHTGNEINVPERAVTPQNLGTREGRFGWHYLASGYAAAWATSNTREAIFDAFNRREVYATTGPRMQVRLFGGFSFSEDDLSSDLVKAGYERGVPMGGEISTIDAEVPTFIVAAQMDPQGANLDRIQIVKGWLDATGQTQERIYNVVWSEAEQRMLDEQGRLPAVGNTVNLEDATWTNSIGSVELSAVWQDPDFNPAENAFYYARVLEIPTPSWPLYDAVRYELELGDDVRRFQQERAYTSPIWYKPPAGMYQLDSDAPVTTQAAQPLSTNSDSTSPVLN